MSDNNNVDDILEVLGVNELISDQKATQKLNLSTGEITKCDVFYKATDICPVCDFPLGYPSAIYIVKSDKSEGGCCIHGFCLKNVV